MVKDNFLHYYKIPGEESKIFLLNKIQKYFSFILSIEIEDCFNIELKKEENKIEIEVIQNNLNSHTNKEFKAQENNQQEEEIINLNELERKKLFWILSETFQPHNLTLSSNLHITENNKQIILEVGPRLTFSTAWSTNCLSICLACNIKTIKRIEKSRRYLITSSIDFTNDFLINLQSLFYDRMTECIYETPLTSFTNKTLSEPLQYIEIIEKGRAALEEINHEKGLGFDEWDLNYYTQLFQDKLCRNPSDVEVRYLEFCLLFLLFFFASFQFLISFSSLL